MTDTTRVQRAFKPARRRRPRPVPPQCTLWESAPGEPPANVTITWGFDAHDTTTIDLTGELCTRTVQRIGGLMTHVAQHSPADVAIDASSVTFIDCRGLSLLLGLQGQLAQRELRCRIVSPSRVVRRLFQLAGAENRLCWHFTSDRPPSG
jgi:anti-anti-sigma factor